MTLTPNQRAALVRAQRNPPMIRLRKVTADALIARGYMVETGIMRPVTGIYVKLTASGRAWKGET